MKLRTLLLLTAMTATMSFATGCGDSGSSETPNGGEHAHGDKHGDGAHTTGTVEIEGRVIEVSFEGELEAGKHYHCHPSVTGDPIDELRVWIGDASAEGSLKSRVEGLGTDHVHVELVAPADIEGAVLGVEVEIDGETYTATAELGHDGHGHEDEEDGHNH